MAAAAPQWLPIATILSITSLPKALASIVHQYATCKRCDRPPADVSESKCPSRATLCADCHHTHGHGPNAIRCRVCERPPCIDDPLSKVLMAWTTCKRCMREALAHMLKPYQGGASRETLAYFYPGVYED